MNTDVRQFITKPPLRVGWDIDGVVADFNPAFARIVKEEFDKDLPLGDDLGPSTWNYHLKTDGGPLTKDMDEHIWWLITTSPDFWSRLSPTANGLMTLEKLNELQVTGVLEPYFITARPSNTARAQSVEWLKRMGMSDPHVLPAKNAAAKAVLCVTLGIEMFVEDNFQNAAAIAEAIGSCHLVHRNYNAFFGHPKVTRVLHPYAALAAQAKLALERRQA